MDRGRLTLAAMITAFLFLSAWFAISYAGAGIPSVQAIENEKYFPSLISAIRDAKTEIDVVMFEAKYYTNYRYSKPNEILDELRNASSRGVVVRVILEGGDEFLGDDFSKASASACDYLSSGGVDVRFDPENVTTHAKLVIIDSDTVIIGSTNWNYYAIEENNEASVLVHSAGLARSLGSYFENLWLDSSRCRAG